MHLSTNESESRHSLQNERPAYTVRIATRDLSVLSIKVDIEDLASKPDGTVWIRNGQTVFG